MKRQNNSSQGQTQQQPVQQEQQYHDNGSNRRPDSIAYSVQQTGNGNSYWNKIGAAWNHRDGQGIDIQLQSIPVDGHVTLRDYRPEHMQNYSQQQPQSVQNQEQKNSQTMTQERGRER